MSEKLKGIPCKNCELEFHYNDELVFFLGDTMVEVSEKYPDWSHAICTTCAEKKNLI